MAITISGTTGVAGVDGSASAPATAGTDSNSGIFYGADVIKFSTGGTERMSITNSGVTGAGVFSSYASICDQKSSGTAGGEGSTSTWNIRDLNTEITDPDGIVSISSNKFTLGAGNYLIKWTTPGHRINRNQSRLYDVTNTAVIGYGQSMRSYQSDVTTTNSKGFARVTPSGSTEYRIEHNYESHEGGEDFGQGNSFGSVEIYTIVEIYKEA